MKLTLQKRLAADILKCSEKKIAIDPARLEEVKEAITKKDIISLIKDKAITKKRPQHSSRSRARKRKIQRSKGKRKGHGSRKGKINSRISKKERWAVAIRAQRKMLKELRRNNKISAKVYNSLYMKSKGGFFRSCRHIDLYIKEHNLLKK